MRRRIVSREKVTSARGHQRYSAQEIRALKRKSPFTSFASLARRFKRTAAALKTKCSRLRAVRRYRFVGLGTLKPGRPKGFTPKRKTP